MTADNPIGTAAPAQGESILDADVAEIEVSEVLEPLAADDLINPGNEEIVLDQTNPFAADDLINPGNEEIVLDQTNPFATDEQDLDIVEKEGFSGIDFETIGASLSETFSEVSASFNNAIGMFQDNAASIIASFTREDGPEVTSEQTVEVDPAEQGTAFEDLPVAENPFAGDDAPTGEQSEPEIDNSGPAISGQDGQVMPFDQDTLALQTNLAALNIDIGSYDDGSPMLDGLEGDLTRGGIEQYAEMHGLDVNAMSVNELIEHTNQQIAALEQESAEMNVYSTNPPADFGMAGVVGIAEDYSSVILEGAGNIITDIVDYFKDLVEADGVELQTQEQIIAQNMQNESEVSAPAVQNNSGLGLG
jgi:hypothetical protein